MIEEAPRPLLVLIWAVEFLVWRLLGLRTAPDARWRGIPKIREHARIEHPRGVCLGRDVSLRPYSFLRSVPGRIVIGAGTYVGDFTIINARESVLIGAKVTIGPFCFVTDANHLTDRQAPIQEQGWRAKEVVIGDDVWLGAGVKVLAGVRLGEGAVVGAGSVVTRDVDPYHVVAGVPARVVRRSRGRATARVEPRGPVGRDAAGDPPPHHPLDLGGGPPAIPRGHGPSRWSR